jgi:hypothetical protein
MADATQCIRCGKTRIAGKTWTEQTPGGVVTYTMTVCPDDECQKIVEHQLQEKKERIEKIQEESLKRRSNGNKSKKMVDEADMA